MTSKYDEHFKEVDSYYQMMYPDIKAVGLNTPVPGFTLDEVTIPDFYTDILPKEVSLKTKIGPVKLNFGAITAVMDTVCGPDLAKVAFETGCLGIFDRTGKVEQQLKWLREVLDHQPCLINNAKILPPDAPLSRAEDINKKHNISTIPIVKNRKLEGILFTGPIIWEGHRHELVSDWMKSVDGLNAIGSEETFDEVNDFMCNRRKKDSVLPVINKKGHFCGMYFAQDFRNLDPSYHNKKPVIGVAIGEKEKEIEFAKAAIEMGACMVVIDSSHGDCEAILKQSKRLVRVNENYGAAIVVGNYAGIKGYLDFAKINGIHAVKHGIGSGSICTTTEGSGIGAPIFTGLQESNFVRRKLIEENKPAPDIIIDGSVEAPGHIVKCFAGGAVGIMGGKYFVAASESISAIKKNFRKFDGNENTYVLYRGMASYGAIKERKAKRYNEGKAAPEGKTGWVKLRGPLKKWIGKDKELVKIGFSHVWAKNLKEIRRYGEWRYAFRSFSPIGLNQIGTRIRNAF